MASRTFAQINGSLLRSRKLRGVSHAARWAYLCTHLSQLSSFTGVFCYPSVLWERDANLQGDEFQTALDELVTTNLIEWSQEEELVRVVNCHRQRPPQNASWCVNLIADFDGLLSTYDDTGLVLRASAEFSVASVARSVTWKPDSPEVPKLRTAVGRFLRAICQDHEETFLEMLVSETHGANKAVTGEFDALLPSLAMYRRDIVRTPCRDRSDIPRPRQDLDQNQKKDLDSDDANSELSHKPQPEKPAAPAVNAENVGKDLGTGSQHGPTHSLQRSALVVEMRGCA